MARNPGEQPKYRAVADALRKRIAAGEFSKGGKLPTERDLRPEYGVSLATVRQALGVLRDEGLLESRVGSGWFLTQWQPIVRNALNRLSSAQWGEGRSMWDMDIEDRTLEAIDVEVERTEAPDDVARALEVEVGTSVCRRSRRYVVGGKVVMRATSHVPSDLADGTRITQKDTGPGGTYARLREAGHGPVKFREEIRCRLASPEEVEDLKLAAGVPVVEQHRSAMRADGRVVEVNRMILDASKFLLVYDFSA